MNVVSDTPDCMLCVRTIVVRLSCDRLKTPSQIGAWCVCTPGASRVNRYQEACRRRHYHPAAIHAGRSACRHSLRPQQPRPSFLALCLRPSSGNTFLLASNSSSHRACRRPTGRAWMESHPHETSVTRSAATTSSIANDREVIVSLSLSPGRVQTFSCCFPRCDCRQNRLSCVSSALPWLVRLL